MLYKVDNATSYTDDIFLLTPTLDNVHDIAIGIQYEVALSPVAMMHCKKYLVKMTTSEGYCSFRVH